MSRIVGFVFSTGAALMGLLATAVWIWLRPGSKVARRLLLAVAVSYTVASIYAVPSAASRLLSYGYREFRPTDVASKRTAVVVLGATTSVVQGWNAVQLSVPSTTEAARVLEAFRIFKLVDPEWIIGSGGPPDRERADPDSIIMRNLLVNLGVPVSRILLESESQTTHQQAALTVPMLRALKVEQAILVTSEFHMRRSLGAFRAQGWHVVPAVAPDPNRTEPWQVWFLPSATGLSFSGGVVHEVLGIGGYWMRGDWRP